MSLDNDEAAEPISDAKDARTTDRMSVRSQRIEVITRGERRRRWSVEQKREIVAEVPRRQQAPTGAPYSGALSVSPSGTTLTAPCSPATGPYSPRTTLPASVTLAG
jgi:hypothetical protein